MNNDFEEAVRIVKNGGIIIFPTDTAFGIGCRIDDERAIHRLFVLRKRPVDKAVPVLCSSVEMVEQYAEHIEPSVRDLMEKYWPGGLTIIIECRIDKVPMQVRGGTLNMGVRIPDNTVARELIEKVGVPILGPSANFSGQPTPFDYSLLDQKLIIEVDFVLSGNCILKKASTVLDCTVTPWKILRHGAVQLDIDELAKGNG